MGQKHKIRLNWVDFLILGLAALAVVTVLLLRNNVFQSKKETSPMTFTVELRGISENTIQQMQEGETIYLANDGKALGKLQKVTIEPHTQVSYSEEEKAFVKVTLENHWDAYLTVENEGYLTEETIVIGSYVTRVGSEIAVEGKGFVGNGFVVAVDVKEASGVSFTQKGKGDTTLTYSITFEGNRHFFTDELHVGDPVFDKTTGALLGTIQSIEMETQKIYMVVGNEVLLLPKDGYYTTTLTLQGQCVEKEEGYFMDGVCEVKVGRGGTALTPWVTGIYTTDSIHVR